MSKINCKADNCCYNKSQMCQKDQIQIDGRTAHLSSETCCQSFSDKEDKNACKTK